MDPDLWLASSSVRNPTSPALAAVAVISAYEVQLETQVSTRPRRDFFPLR
jgi:hypothetical protein